MNATAPNATAPDASAANTSVASAAAVPETAVPETAVHKIVLGDVTITRVTEYYRVRPHEPAGVLPRQPRERLGGPPALAGPDFLAADTDICQSAVQTWVVRSEGRTILVDTGVGNHKERPYAPVWSHLRTGYLDNLARAGVRPDDVDLVINTHLHVDHVGWNTFLDGGVWTPTFPRATYLMPRRDFEFWDPARGHTPRLGRGNQNVFEDSVAPVHEAGQTLLWDEEYTIDANLRLELSPGHTPGSAVLKLASGGDRAVFVGDLLHTPLQFVEPDVNSCFCEHPARARASRHRLLGWAAYHRALVLPAHLGGHGGAEVSRSRRRLRDREVGSLLSPLTPPRTPERAPEHLPSTARAADRPSEADPRARPADRTERAAMTHHDPHTPTPTVETASATLRGRGADGVQRFLGVP